MALQGDDLREWDRRARLIHKSHTSRRFSASYIGSFREDTHKSTSRTNFNNISSTPSSPGYSLKEEIDPSKYSFTNALKALQAKTKHNNREWLAQEGFALNSKWNEAERFICNPLSGEVPMECLSSKTLSSRSFRKYNTMSAPLHYYPKSNPNNIGQNNKPNDDTDKDLYAPDDHVLFREKKVVGLKRNVSIQSTSVDVSSGSPSPAKTPPIMERSMIRHVEANDSSVDFNLELETHQEAVKFIEQEYEEEKQQTNMKKEEEENQHTNQEEEEKQQLTSEEEEEEEVEEEKKKKGSGCFPWIRSKQRRTRKSKYIFPICVPHLVKGH